MFLRERAGRPGMCLRQFLTSLCVYSNIWTFCSECWLLETQHPTAFPDKLYPAIAVGFQAPCSQRFCLWAWRNTGLGPAETHKLTPILFNQVTPWYFAGSESSQPVKGSLDEVWSRHIKLGQWPVRFLLRAGLLRVGSNIHLSGKSFVSLKEGRGAYICTLLPPV